jgi:hypothetical protein
MEDMQLYGTAILTLVNMNYGCMVKICHDHVANSESFFAPCSHCKCSSGYGSFASSVFPAHMPGFATGVSTLGKVILAASEPCLVIITGLVVPTDRDSPYSFFCSAGV